MEKTLNKDLQRLSHEQFKHSDKKPYIIILDNVRSMANVGSAFRTGDAFLTEKICLCGITATPPHREIQKTALGATESVTWEYHADTLILTKQLQEQGYKIVVIEQTEPKIYLNEFQPEKKQTQESQKYAFIKHYKSSLSFRNHDFYEAKINLNLVFTLGKHTETSFFKFAFSQTKSFFALLLTEKYVGSAKILEMYCVQNALAKKDTEIQELQEELEEEIEQLNDLSDYHKIQSEFYCNALNGALAQKAKT